MRDDARALHLRPGAIALVAAGGAAGTLARYGTGLVVSTSGPVPLEVLLVNVTGAFVLGGLLDVLRRAGGDLGRRRDVRLLAGVGFLGGFTTYSALALDTAELMRDDRLALALGYGAGSVVAGLLAALVGTRLVRRFVR